jgi:hypothetical protein
MEETRKERDEKRTRRAAAQTSTDHFLGLTKTFVLLFVLLSKTPKAPMEPS